MAPRLCMQLVQPPASLATLSLDRAVFLAGSIDLGKSVDWQAELALALADCPGILLNPRRAQWDSSWLAQAAFAPFREQVQWELAAMEAAGMIAFYFAPQSQAPVTLLELGLAAGCLLPSGLLAQGKRGCRVCALRHSHGCDARRPWPGNPKLPLAGRCSGANVRALFVVA